MNSKNIIVAAFMALLLSSCDYQKQNTKEQKDLREGDKVVYGAGLDSAAAQTKLKYPTKPEYEARAEKIRAKLASQR